MISWRENKLRWILCYYLIGLIAGCLGLFLEESFFPLESRYFYKCAFLFVLAPGVTLLVSIMITTQRR